MKSSSRVQGLAFVPVVVATFACAWLADAQEASGKEVATPVVAAEVSSTMLPEQATPIAEPLTATLQPVEAWPKAGEAPSFPLLEYTGVAQKAQMLLEDEYQDWRAYLDASPQPQTLPQNLLKSTGCVAPCDMHKALLVVDTEEQGVFVAMVKNGHVLMRPSLMSWPDAAIAPLKKWLAATEAE